MTIQMKCDSCGKVGSPEEFSSYLSDSDLCPACAKVQLLKDLKQNYDSKKEWLESTHLKDLRKLEEHIKEVEDGMKI